MTLPQEISDPISDGPGFTAPRARQDQNRTFNVLYRSLLWFI
jgi:hypothetical protein